MALIKCPECGNEVSDKAPVCPKCAFPIADSIPSGTVRIKMSALRAVLGGRQKVTMSSEGKTLWTGVVGQIAEVRFDKATTVNIEYHLSPMHYGGKCSGVIDPTRGKKYSVQVRQGVMKTVMELQRVDVIDSD